LPKHTLIVLGAPRMLGDLLAGAVAPVDDVRLVVEPGPVVEERGAVLRALEAEPEATVITVDADGRQAVAWRLAASPIEPLSLDALIAAARYPA